MAFPFPGSTNAIGYATSVSAALAQVWLYDPSFALRQDAECYEKQQRDLVVSGALDVLQRSIVGHAWHFEPDTTGDTALDRKGRDLARIVESLTKQQRFFPQALYNLSRATHRGASWARIYSEKRVLRIFDGKPREWTVVSKVKDVDKRRFRLVQAPLLAGSPGAPVPVSPLEGADAGALGRFRWEFYRGYDVLGQSNGQWQSLESAAPLDRWVMHAPDTSEWGLGYGYGLADELQAFFWLKGTFLRWAAQAAERYGQGFLFVSTKALRDGMAKGMSQAAALQATVNVIRQWRSENFAAVDEASKVELLDMPSEGMRWIFEWVRYLDNGMRQRILAALQPTGSGDGDGGYSSAKVEEGSTEDMVHYLRSPLEEAWTHSVAQFLVRENEPHLRELGLEGLTLPRLRLKGRERRNVEEMIKVFDLAARLKIPVRLEDFYQVFNLTPPNEEDQAISYPEAPVAGGFGLDDPSKPFGHDESDGDERGPVGEGGGAVADRKAAA